MSNDANDQIWCYAPIRDAEQWDGSCSTREEAIREGARELETAPGGKFFIARGHKPDPVEFMPSVDWIIDTARDNAVYECGEVAERWPEHGDLAKGALTDLLAEWARKFAPINFWMVDDSHIEEITAPEAIQEQGEGSAER